METVSTPFAYVAALSGLGLGIAAVVHLFGYFLAPERIVPYFQNP